MSFRRFRVGADDFSIHSIATTFCSISTWKIELCQTFVLLGVSTTQGHSGPHYLNLLKNRTLCLEALYWLIQPLNLEMTPRASVLVSAPNLICIIDFERNLKIDPSKVLDWFCQIYIAAHLNGQVMPSRPVLTPTYSDHTSMTSNEGKKAFRKINWEIMCSDILYFDEKIRLRHFCNF